MTLRYEIKNILSNLYCEAIENERASWDSKSTINIATDEILQAIKDELPEKKENDITLYDDCINNENGGYST